MSPFLKRMIVVVSALFQFGCSVFGVHSEEGPKYQVLRQENDKEIRLYEGYIVAKTTVKGAYRDAQYEAFRRLAGYIFGDNVGKKSVAMTSPVGMEPAEKQKGQKIAMTAPVEQVAADDGWVMAFMMPSEYKMSDLPVPNDKRIEFAQVEPATKAVIRYSGYANAEKNAEKAQELKSWIESLAKASGASTEPSQIRYEITRGPVFYGYNPPWTLPFWRRNEMSFDLK